MSDRDPDVVPYCIVGTPVQEEAKRLLAVVTRFLAGGAALAEIEAALAALQETASSDALVPDVVYCACSLKERLSGHRVDCEAGFHG